MGESDCQHIREMLDPYLDNELLLETNQSVLDHLSFCVRQPYMHIEELAPWLPPPTDQQLASANQTREEASKQARDAEQQRAKTFSKMSSGMYLVTVSGAMHNSFSDLPLISPARYSNIQINAARALTITNAYILAFFDRYLRGKRQPLLESNASTFPEVTVQVYRPQKPPAHR